MKRGADSKSCVPYVHAYVPVRWYVRYGCMEVHFNFLYKYLYNGFDAPEPPDPAALVVPDVVGMLQVVFLLMLGKIGTEAFGGHRLGGIVITP